MGSLYIKKKKLTRAKDKGAFHYYSKDQTLTCMGERGLFNLVKWETSRNSILLHQGTQWCISTWDIQSPLTSCPPSRAQSLVLCFLASTNTLNIVHTEAGMRKSVVLLAFCSLSSNAVLVLFIKTWIQSKNFWHMSHLFCKSEITTTRC